MNQNIMQISDIVMAHKETIYARNGKPPEFPLISLPSINRKLWGFKRQKLILIGARPGNGKSLLLLQLGYDFATQGRTVYFFSFEMSKEVCAERVIARNCQIDNFTLTNGKVAEINRHKIAIDQFIEKSSGFNFHIFETIGQSLPALNSIITKIDGRPDIVMIDYGNLVSDMPGRSKKEVYDEYIKGIRALAIKENICVIMGTQINRGVAGKDGRVREPMLDDLKDTGELEQTSDIVMLLHYPFTHTDIPEDRGKFIIKIAKNRDGRTGRVNCKIIPELCLIEETEEINGQHQRPIR